MTNLQQRASQAIRYASGVFTTAERIQKELTTRFSYLPTTRSVMILSFGLYLVFGPVPLHADLFAAVIGYSLLICTTLILGLTAILGKICHSSATYHIHFRVDDREQLERPTSRHLTSLSLLPNGVRVPPLFFLQVTPIFRSTDLHPASNWKIVGTPKPGSFLTQSVVFPHRGLWQVNEIDAIFCDTFGLGRVRHRFVSNELPIIPVHPPSTASRALPIFTAETTSGSEQVDVQNSEGDPYEIKRYQPADGLRRILWKVYAKSGELLSRYPEPATTPEGTVAAYVLAGSRDDDLCSLALSHLRDLESQHYEFLMSLDGDQSCQLASSVAQGEELVLSTVWDSEYSTEESRWRAISTISNRLQENGHSQLKNLTIFVSLLRLADPNFYEEFLLFLSKLAYEQIAALVIIFEPPATPDSENPKSWIHRLVLTPVEGGTDATPYPPSIANERLVSEALLGRVTADCDAFQFPYIITK